MFNIKYERAYEFIEGEDKIPKNSEPLIEDIDKNVKDLTDNICVLPINHFKLFDFYISESNIRLMNPI